MITLAPISKNIQRTLRQKIAMLKKGTGGQVYDKKKDDWVDGNYAFNMPLSTEGKPSISQNYMFARTPWLRMTSFTPMQGTNNTAVVIMGGEVGLSEKIQNIMGTVNNEKDGISTEISTRKTLSGFKDLYRKSGNIPYRPIAGVKDISIEYKGGGMKLGATRTGEINWTCWDWEQLDRLTPHFLHPGKTVLLEWGWSGIGDLKNTQSYPLFNDGTLNFDDDKLDKLTEKLLTHIQSQNGHYDAMLKNISLNPELSKKITPINAAVGKDGILKFYQSGKAEIAEAASFVYNIHGKDAKTTEITGYSLKSAYEKFNLKHIDLLKMDCKGCEYFLTEDDLINVNTIKIEYTNFDDSHKLEDLLKNIKKSGFQYTIYRHIPDYYKSNSFSGTLYAKRS